MALDFSGVVTQAYVDALIAERNALIVSLAALPAVDVSDQGRSVNGNASRTAMTARLAAIKQELIDMAGSYFGTSRMRA